MEARLRVRTVMSRTLLTSLFSSAMLLAFAASAPAQGLPGKTLGDSAGANPDNVVGHQITPVTCSNLNELTTENLVQYLANNYAPVYRLTIAARRSGRPAEGGFFRDNLIGTYELLLGCGG